MKNKIIIIGGPTASGKSDYALKLAKRESSVIINADSRQIYNVLPIITAQPPKQDKSVAPHYLYGFLDPGEKYSVARWITDTVEKINAAHSSNITPILVGGTGLYLKCIMQGMSAIPDIAKEIRDKARELLEEVGNQSFHEMLSERDPAMGEKLKPGDSQRIVRAWEVIEQTDKSLDQWQQEPNKMLYDKAQFEGYFINPPRDILYERINNRFIYMIDNGVIDEVKEFLATNPPANSNVMHSYGLPEISLYLKGEITLDEAISQAQQDTRNYAKRQITWFRHQLPELKEIS